jgi:excinuclease UvrABC ATPase subunit
MHNKTIIIENAHANNLKNIYVEIPKHKLVVFTGVSGSGKSSLLFDTIYTEAQRQLIETFIAFARTRMPKLSRPDVDDIHNLSLHCYRSEKNAKQPAKHRRYSHRGEYLPPVALLPAGTSPNRAFFLFFV